MWKEFALTRHSVHRAAGRRGCGSKDGLLCVCATIVVGKQKNYVS
jgi:hypothetical protein